MKRLFAALGILASLSCLAQVNLTGAKLSGFTTGPNNQPAVPPTPTTLSGGEVPLVWYQGSIGTNGSVVTVTNLAASGSGYNLTNSGASSTWPVGGKTINSMPAMAFKSSNMYLKDDSFTNGISSGFTVGMVIAFTNGANALDYVFDSTNTSAHRSLIGYSGNYTYFDNGVVVTLNSLNNLTNTPLSLILVAYPTNSSTASPTFTLYTNGVSCGTVSTAAEANMGGLVLGNRNGLDSGGSFTFADMEFYTNLSSASISDLHTYHHNTFGVP